MGRWLRMVMALVVVAVVAFAISDAWAASGDLDPDFAGFGVGGKIADLGFYVLGVAMDHQGRLILAGSSETFVAGMVRVQRRSGVALSALEDLEFQFDPGEDYSSAEAVAVAPDGKIVVAGRADFAGSRQLDFGVARLDADFTIDDTFDGGMVVTDMGDDDFANGLAIGTDKKPVVVGTNGFQDWVGERLTTNGSLDTGFDGDGKWSHDESGTEYASGVAIQDDQKIVITGSVEIGIFDFYNQFQVIRLNSNGSADDSFGDNGVVQTDFGGDAFAQAVAVTPGQKILVAGQTSSQFIGGTIKVVRYLTGGGIDPDFGDGGVVTLLPSFGAASVEKLVVQPDGKFLVVGHYGYGNDFVLLRYHEDGSPDLDFGNGGLVDTSIGGMGGQPAVGAVVQSDGALAVAGGTAAARYDYTGALDTGGTASIQFIDDQASGEATALAVQGGKLVAAGVSYGSDYDMAIARFAADQGDLDLTFGNGTPKTGRTSRRLALEDEVIHAAAIDADGKLLVAGQTQDQVNGQLMFVARYKDDGTIDSSCAIDGYARTDFGLAQDGATGVAPGPNGTIYVAGPVRGPTGTDIGLVRFTSACHVDKDAALVDPQDLELRIDLGGEESVGGMVVDGTKPVIAAATGGQIVLTRIRYDAFERFQVDTTFGTSGYTHWNPGGTATVAGIARLASGQLLVAGTVTNSGDSDFFVARFSQAGILDKTFGTQGVATANFNLDDAAHAIAVAPDGRVAVVGSTTGAQGTVFAVAQFTSSGQLDTTFHGNGKVTHKFAAAGEDVAQAVTYLGGNDLVVGGYSNAFGKRQFTLAEFQSAPEASCGDFNNDGSVTAADALGALRSAVGSTTCLACVCDANNSSSIGASDALLILKFAVGQGVVLACPACG